MCPHGAAWGPAGRCGTITFVGPFGKRSDDSLEEKTRWSVLDTGSLEVGTAHVGFVQLLVMSPNVDPTAPHSASGNMQTLPSPPALNPVSDIWGSCFHCRAVVSNVWSPDQLGQHLLGTSEAQRGAVTGNGVGSLATRCMAGGCWCHSRYPAQLNFKIHATRSRIVHKAVGHHRKPDSASWLVSSTLYDPDQTVHFSNDIRCGESFSGLTVRPVRITAVKTQANSRVLPLCELVDLKPATWAPDES